MRAPDYPNWANEMTNNLSPLAAARLGANHGYCFDGDFVALNADISFPDLASAAACAWSLQLWASASGFPDGLPTGVKVAEMAVFPSAEWVEASASCPAMPPAGSNPYVMALVLVASDLTGSQVCDLASYAVPESFCQPGLLGEVACRLADGQASLSIEAIGNPRAADNLSGTLALEVWALDTPYSGGAWCGLPVASVVLGVLAGGEQWSACHYTVPAALPDAAAGLTVMLREWTPAGYVTRDYRQIAAAPVLSAEPEKKAVLAKPAKKVAARKVAVKKTSTPAKVSANKASLAELEGVKGLPGKVAAAIVAARPYAKLDDLCKAKGMGPKLLAKLRDQFVL